MSDEDRTRALLRWLGTIDLPQVAVLVCADAELPPLPQGAVGIHLPGCVSDVGVGLPAQVLAFGVPRVEVATCPKGDEVAAARVHAWSAVLDGVAERTEAPRRPRRRGGPVFDLARPTVSRRMLFGAGVLGGFGPDAGLSEQEREVAALRILSESGRARLSDVTPATSPRAETEPDDDACVAISLRATGCDACGVCARACPTGALRLTADDSGSVLVHLPARCQTDRRCIDLCPQRALTVTGSLTLAQIAESGPVELARIETARCDRCHAPHPSSEGPLCRACSFRRAHAFGSSARPL